jgi:superfamily II DNA or RNA helicase/HKD family nuclease
MDFLHLQQSLTTGFIDRTCKSSEILRPKLLLNKQPEKKILNTIQSEIRTCTSFELFVAFITDGGLMSILQTLKDFDKKGFKGKILTSTYLNFTSPNSIQSLRDDFESIEIRVYDGNLHSKGYSFYHDDYATLIIGSSNITEAALSSTRELNIQLISSSNGEVLHQIHSEFEEAWQSAIIPSPIWLEQYRRVFRCFDSLRRKIKPLSENEIAKEGFKTREQIVPNQMQIDALEALGNLRSKGEEKGLLISATGTGKTILSAMDAYAFNPKKLLFVVHREMILNDALNSFKLIFGDNLDCETYTGGKSHPNSRFVFSMPVMLSSHLNDFKPDEFDYIIIDEAHRSSADTYKVILDYFKPKFLLGMTATPERTDGQDIYQLFDNNIAYEIRLSDALKENLLCDFHYFGVTDMTINGAIVDDKTEFNKLVSPERAKRIKETIAFYSMYEEERKGLVFCSRTKEAQDLSIQLNMLGMKTLALSGSNNEQEREAAIGKLKEGRINYILTVDIFNEGVDIPFVNQVIMLRPTQSAIIFVQQLGRGLRKLQGKDYLTVIDFIGNYQKNFLIPVALFGDNSYNKDNLRKVVSGGSQGIFGNSTVDFDLISKENIYKAINETNFSQLGFLYEQYQNLKAKLGRIPKLTDFESMDTISPLRFCPPTNQVKTYFEFRCKKEGFTSSDFGISMQHLSSLRFFTQILPRGMRPQELFIIEACMNGETDFEAIKASAQKISNCILDQRSWDSAIAILQNQFFKKAEKDSFGNIEYIRLINGHCILPTTEFDELLKNQTYKTELNDIVQVGLMEFRRRSHASVNKTKPGNLIINNKYSRKDACILLNWANNYESTIYGYKMDYDTNTCPIFITYDKDSSKISESTNYQDEFINEETFKWFSRNKRTTSSEELQGLINQNTSQTRIPLFVKKSDGEGTDFYYLGDLSTISFLNDKILDKGSKLDIVKFLFHMNTPVDENLLNYLNSKPSGFDRTHDKLAAQ